MFTITIEDIERYLDSKKDDEVIGYAHESAACLVAEAITQKYQFKLPDECVRVGLRNAYIHTSEIRMRIALSEDVQEVVDRFDRLGGERPVTKREWLKARVRA